MRTSPRSSAASSLDEQGRFEVLEFMPRVRSHDRQFNAPQTMFDEGYTSLFHFHFHAQRKRNEDHAGPGLGDMNYADNTRANWFGADVRRLGSHERRLLPT